jgi:hypothetical protein
MSKIVSLSKLTTAFSMFFLLVSCGMDGKSITGSGNVTTQNRTMTGEFTKVKAEKGLDIVIEQAPSPMVIVEADDNLQGKILTTVENGVLKITCEYNSYINVKAKKVTVKMPVIEGIETESGVSLRSEGVLKSNDIKISASSGSSIEVNVESEKVTVESSSGSQINLSGKAINLSTSSSSGSSIEAGNLIANDVEADASSGSSTSVHAAVSINAGASSGSSIEYKGNPKKITKDESSGGGISGQ